MKSRGLPFAAALIVGTNAIVLLGVARNQAGPPLETVQLTERELPREPHGKEDSGLSLRFQWQRFGFPYIDQYTWLDRAKLEELGFDYQGVLRDPKHPPLERPAFLALEYNGPHWEEWLKAMENQPNAARRYSSPMDSRLFVIDAARKPEPLLEKYKDQQRYIVMRGVVRVDIVNWGPIAKEPNRLQASVSRLLPESIHVPLPLSSTLASLPTGSNPTSPGYTVTLSFGRLFEPWIVIKPEH